MNHYHPTISLHARQLLSSTPITGSPDLSLNTLSHFLDRFVYKNPKKPKPKGQSAMQPSLDNASSAHGVTLVKGEVGLGLPVNDGKFWKRRVEDVPVDQVFFHTYFVQKEEREKKKAEKVGKRKGKRGQEGSDLEESESEDAASEAESIGGGDDDVEEEVEEGGDESDSEDGGFDLSGAGKMPAAASQDAAVEGESGSDDDSDAEEAEIWKVRYLSNFVIVCRLTNCSGRR